MAKRREKYGLSVQVWPPPPLPPPPPPPPPPIRAEQAVASWREAVAQFGGDAHAAAAELLPVRADAAARVMA